MSYGAHELRDFQRELGFGNWGMHAPSDDLVDRAAADVPVVLPDAERHAYIPLGNPEPDALVVTASELVRQLRRRGHSEAAAAWAIFAVP